MSRPRLLDLFCGAGGAAMGYYRAGFDVVGVDVAPQKRYPFEFVQADAIEYVAEHGREFDVIHASPPCQGYSVTRSLATHDFAMLVPQVRALLQNAGKPYVIENVVGAPLVNPLMLCGTMFGLRVIRHRLFECSPAIYFPPMACCHNGKSSGNNRIKHANGTTTPTLAQFAFLTITGNDYLSREGGIAMSIDWMVKRELSQAIPPAYTGYIGKKLLEAMK